MKHVFDEDSANDVVFENRAYYRWEWGKRKYILGLYSSERKQREWNKLYPKTDLAIYGLTDEQLLEINNTVY